MSSSTPPSLIQPLFSGPIDIIGDVHGEFEALNELLSRLGYPQRGPHPEGRRLVYVGDLVDRGPDSPAVVEQVMHQVNTGLAQCTLGNHELSFLLSRPDRPNRKHGNHWFWDEREPIGQGKPDFKSRGATQAQRDQFKAFFSRLPLALEREDLRVVHACWDAQSIQEARQFEDAEHLYRSADRASRESIQRSGLEARSLAQQAQYRDELRDEGNTTLPFLEEIAAHHVLLQIENPVKVLSSGIEEPLAPNMRPYHIGGKWRMTVRVPWWKRYTDTIPVVFGHYWRRPDADERPRDTHVLFGDLDSKTWLGPQQNCFCIDLSVGRRFLERAQGRTSSRSVGTLAALRLPEWRLVMDDRPSQDLEHPGPR